MVFILLDVGLFIILFWVGVLFRLLRIGVLLMLSIDVLVGLRWKFEGWFFVGVLDFKLFKIGMFKFKLLKLGLFFKKLWIFIFRFGEVDSDFSFGLEIFEDWYMVILVGGVVGLVL